MKSHASECLEQQSWTHLIGARVVVAAGRQRVHMRVGEGRARDRARDSVAVAVQPALP